MAHWAEIDENNVVIRVTTGDNNDPNGDEGYQWLVDNLGGTWVQTSYNATFRKNYAGIGYTYNADLDAFIAPQPFDSWVLNQTTCKWEAPAKMPIDGENYTWEEASKSWVPVTLN